MLSRLVFLSLALLPASASASPFVFKHDQFPEDLQGAATAVNGGSFYTQPGFVAGEAFGQVYEPAAHQYPIQIKGLDLILAAPPAAASQLFADATIEIYNSDSKNPDPGSAPIFTISTDDLLDARTNTLGFPLTGNVGLSIQFDMSDPQNHPPVITSGRIWAVIRFSDAARDMTAEWGTIQCGIIDLGGLGSIGCGCQNVGTIHDSAITLKANVIHHVTPLGQCSGNKVWAWMESLQSSTGFQIRGDVILRLHADVSDGCTPSCGDDECGSDGCGGQCGSCGEREQCVAGECVGCTPACDGKECGSDGCGGSCGTCDANSTCSAGQCRPNCAPECAGRECGPDGCGGACGPGCAVGELCVSGLCESCTPSCTGRVCGDDGCGGSCGECEGGASCVAGACAACEPSCADKVCGDDGCGGVCGQCESGYSCAAGQCVSGCATTCGAKVCGDDGCGGSCGTCGGESFCEGGACVTVAITRVTPAYGPAGSRTSISITGRGFAANARVRLGGRDLESVEVTSTSLIAAIVPGDLAAGVYPLIVANPDGGLAELSEGFEVRAVEGVKDSGCLGGGLGGFWWLLGLVGISVVRRARHV